MGTQPEPFQSFGRCDAGFSRVERPTCIKAVQELFEQVATSPSRCFVTIRGGGHSFDGQAVQHGDNGTNIILLTDRFATIELDAAKGTVTVGAGASWSSILSECLGKGFIPPIIQTGSHATAGGTLAGDCLSRFSGTLGKESEWVESFTLVAPVGGKPIRCSRSENTRYFNAAIGGHGYLGFVTDITYRVLTFPTGTRPHTHVETCVGLEEILAKQIPATENAFRDGTPTLNVAKMALAGVRRPSQMDSTVRAISSALFISGRHVKGGVFSSSFVQGEEKLRPFPLYTDPKSELRYRAELAARNPFLNLKIHQLLYLYASLRKHFVDDPTFFTFFMDGTTYAKERYEREHQGEPFPLVQQTFVIRIEHTLSFTQLLVEEILACTPKLRPTTFDILPVLEDECLMAATYRLKGFAVSIAFENFKGACAPDQITSLLRRLTEVCRLHGGRIHLVKNLHADKDIVRQMFSDDGNQIGQFEQIKSELDPKWILWNPYADKFLNRPATV